MEKNVITNNGGPAFPVQDASKWQAHGMSLRDYFAAKAMQGMLADLPKTMYGEMWTHNVAIAAYAVADAMLEAQGKINE